MGLSKNYILKLGTCLWQRYSVIIISAIHVLVLSLLSYVLNNQPVFTGEDLNHFAWIQMLKHKLGVESNEKKDDVLYINVAYDKQLIELSDEYGMPIGNTDITDRSKLLSFLQMLHTTDQYAYIFLDVRFEKGYNAPEIDSLLYAEINSMDNIVVANHSDIEIADSALMKKSALSDYDATIVATNFVRYRYSHGGYPSMPLFAYNELTGKSINKHGFLYTCNGKLCYNSLFVDFPIENFSEYNDENNKLYYNLGSDLLDNYTEKDIYTLTKDKYIVIGDMIEDLHDTYSGLKPGSVITFYAFRSLIENKHIVNFWLMLLMSVVYFVISISQFSHRSIFERFTFVCKSHSKLLHFTLSLLEYTTLLSIVVLILDLCWGLSTSILLPSIYFAIQRNIINYKRTKV